MVRPVRSQSPRDPRRSGGGGPPARGRVTRALLIALLVSSVVASLGALVFPGLELAPWLVIGPDTYSGLHLTALVTNTFVNLSGDPGSLFLPIALLALFRLRELPTLLRERWRMLLAWFVGILAVGYTVDRFLLPGVWGILGALLITAVMGPTVERMFGARPFLRFCAKIALTTSAFGAALLWLWPGAVGALVGPGAASPTGIGPLAGAWFLAFVLVLDRRMLDGLDVAINGRMLALVLVAMDVYGALFSGFAAGLMDLLALAMTWLHLQGVGGPRLLLDRLRLWRLERRRAQRQRSVSGGRDDGRIVH